MPARELRDLAERYADGVDRRAFDEVAVLFRPGGVLRVPARGMIGLDEHIGRAAIVAALRAVDRTAATLHAVTGQNVRIDGDLATGTVSGLAHHLVDTADGPRSLVWVLRYADRYGRVDGTWWFTRREVQVRWIESREVTWAGGPEADRAVRAAR